MDKAISILSGGLDSAVSTAIARENHDVKLAVTFDYGQRAARPEIAAAAGLCKGWNIEHRTIPLKILSEIGRSALTNRSSTIPQLSANELEEDPSAMIASAERVWVPNRNAIFINVVAAIAESEGFQWIVTGFNREEAETFPDNSARFIEFINNCLAESTLSHPQVVSYVKEMTKPDILKTALEMKININELWSCYEDYDRWCGKCESCMRLIHAMQNLKIFEKYKKQFVTARRSLRSS